MTSWCCPAAAIGVPSALAFSKAGRACRGRSPCLPVFDVVTGVSTGALIVPFACLGDARSLDTIVELYRNPGPDLVKQRWPLYFLPANESFATVPGLEREMRARGHGYAPAHRGRQPAGALSARQ